MYKIWLKKFFLAIIVIHITLKILTIFEVFDNIQCILCIIYLIYFKKNEKFINDEWNTFLFIK